MRLKDLNTTTTVYAYRTSKYGSARRIQVLDTSKLYSRTSKYEGNKIVPAHPGDKATTGSGYFGRPVGVLFREADVPTGAQQIAYPAHILGPWDVYEVQQAAEDHQRAKDRQREKDFRTQNALDAQRFKELATAHPEIFPPRVYVDAYGDAQKIRTATLIALLEALPQP